jgi:predicted permease
MLVFECFELDPLWAKTAVMVAAMPVAINAYIFSQKYQELQAAIASAIFLSTLAGILTLSVWITVLNTQ